MITYLTGNSKKFEEAQHIFEGWDLDHHHLDLQEIQGSRQEILTQKAYDAIKILNRPLIVEDVTMHCEAIGGLPGPYIKDFLKALGDDGLAALIHKYDNHRAQVICTAAYVEVGKEPIIVEGILDGVIVSPRGDMRHGPISWNPIFQPDGHAKTMGEMTMEEHASLSMRRHALEKLKEQLQGHQP